MGLACTFALNRRAVSQLVCPGVGSFAAFSGRPEVRNDPTAADKADIGPLPPGRYYIVDRQSGGRLGWLRDWFSSHWSVDRNEWFALYRDDGTIDDVTIINGVSRGAFRLHPIGPARRSDGCITLLSLSDFLKLRGFLKREGLHTVIPGKGLAYGTVDVR